MKSLAVIVSRGHHNNLVQVCTLLMASAVSDIKVRVFVRDEAVLKLTTQRVGEINLSDAFRGMESAVKERLVQHKLADLRALLADVKSQGDIQIIVCTSSMAICGVTREALIPEVDDVRGFTSFLLEEMSEADVVLTF